MDNEPFSFADLAAALDDEPAMVQLEVDNETAQLVDSLALVLGLSAEEVLEHAVKAFALQIREQAGS